MATSLTAHNIAADLRTSIVAREVVCFAQLPSTMDEARRRAAAGDDEGLVVLAEEQTSGRGRLGRPWVAPPGSALLLSLLLRPRWLAPERAFALTMLAVTSLCAAIEEVTSLRPTVKWPNDLLLAPQNVKLRIENGESSLPSSTAAAAVESAATSASATSTTGFFHSQFSILNSLPQAKAAGILAELHIHAGAIEWAIIGIGVNVHAHPSPDQTHYPATSLDAALDDRVDRLALLRALLRQIDAGYGALRDDGYDALFASWRARLATLGQAVCVVTPAGPLEGTAVDVTPAGALVVRATDGALHTVTTGDVQA